MSGFSAEKRIHLRRSWSGKVFFENEFGEDVIYLYAKDISLGGLFLEDPPPFKTGGHLFLNFVLPGNKQPLKVTGEVVRFVTHEIGSTKGGCNGGAGIRFVDLDPKTFQHLAAFVMTPVGGR